MVISRSDWEAIVEHAREEAPNECCGYAWARDGRVEGFARAQNEQRSPYGYRLDAKSQFDAWKRGEEDGYEVIIYHSHPRSPAEPSQQDINLAYFPEWTQVIVSLAGEPEMRAWRIADGHVEEEDIHVDG